MLSVCLYLYLHDTCLSVFLPECYLLVCISTCMLPVCLYFYLHVTCLSLYLPACYLFVCIYSCILPVCLHIFLYVTCLSAYLPACYLFACMYYCITVCYLFVCISFISIALFYDYIPECLKMDVQQVLRSEPKEVFPFFFSVVLGVFPNLITAGIFCV